MSTSVKMTWTGDQVAADAHEAVLDGLFVAASTLLAYSGAEVPIKDHILQGSGVVDIDRAAESATVSYGEGAAAEYALAQHEDMTFEHTNGRKAKYLEDPFNEHADELLAHIANAVKKQLGG